MRAYATSGFALATLVLCLPITALGAVIYDNGGPSILNVPSDLDDLGNVPGVDLPLILCDDFTLDAPAILQDVHWWGSYLLDVPLGILPTDDFRLELFADAGGSPELSPFLSLSLGDIGRTDTGGTDILGNAIFEYSMDFEEPVLLAANTTYYLSVANDTDASLATWAWAASEELANLGYNFRAGDNLPWLPNVVPPNLAFELTGPPIPEPASLGLLGLGVTALAMRRAANGRRLP